MAGSQDGARKTVLRAFWRADLGGCQLFKCQRVSGNHMAQGVEEQIGAVTAVKAERHLIQVGLQVFRAEAMPRSHDAPLEKRERRFDSIGVNVALNINSVFVPDGLMLCAVNTGFNHGLWINGEFISDDHVRSEEHT